MTSVIEENEHSTFFEECSTFIINAINGFYKQLKRIINK